MPATKSPMSTTPNSRVLSPIPSKAYLALYLIFGKGEEARKKINERARALLLKDFVDNLQAERFLSDEELEKLSSYWQMPEVNYSAKDWKELEGEFEDWGLEFEPYIVGTLADLLAL
jgi:hypothetical protein